MYDFVVIFNIWIIFLRESLLFATFISYEYSSPKKSVVYNIFIFFQRRFCCMQHLNITYEWFSQKKSVVCNIYFIWIFLSEEICCLQHLFLQRRFCCMQHLSRTFSEVCTAQRSGWEWGRRLGLWLMYSSACQLVLSPMFEVPWVNLTDVSHVFEVSRIPIEILGWQLCHLNFESFWNIHRKPLLTTWRLVGEWLRWEDSSFI